MRDQISLRDHTLANKRAVYVSFKKFKSQQHHSNQFHFLNATLRSYSMICSLIVHLTESNRDK
jgi:hypothetical protein